VGTLLILIFYTIQFLVTYYLTDRNPGWAGSVVVVSFITGKFALYYHPFLQKTKGLYRVLSHKDEANALKKSREEIIFEFDSLNKN
jgi:hypothetical protein